MKNLAMTSASRPQVSALTERTGRDTDLDVLLDGLVARLWITYCEMGCVRLH